MLLAAPEGVALEGPQHAKPRVAAQRRGGAYGNNVVADCWGRHLALPMIVPSNGSSGRLQQATAPSTFKKGQRSMLTSGGRHDLQSSALDTPDV